MIQAERPSVASTAFSTYNPKGRTAASRTFCERNEGWGSDGKSPIIIATRPDATDAKKMVPNIIAINPFAWYYMTRHLEVALKRLLMRTAVHEKYGTERYKTHNGRYNFKLEHVDGKLVGEESTIDKYTFQTIITLHRMNIPFPEARTPVGIEISREEEYMGCVVPRTAEMQDFQLRMFVHRQGYTSGVMLDERCGWFSFGPAWASPQRARIKAGC